MINDLMTISLDVIQCTIIDSVLNSFVHVDFGFLLGVVKRLFEHIACRA
jgi:hypothetical protein